MLIQFSVKNFMSFKDKQVFSMEAGTGDENIENIINVKRFRKNKFNKSIFCSYNDDKIIK